MHGTEPPYQRHSKLPVSRGATALNTTCVALWRVLWRCRAIRPALFTLNKSQKAHSINSWFTCPTASPLGQQHRTVQ